MIQVRKNPPVDLQAYLHECCPQAQTATFWTVTSAETFDYGFID